MAFKNSINRWLKTQTGTSLHYSQLAQSGNSNVIVPLPSPFWPGNPKSGYIRIKQSTLGTNGTANIRSIQATDGINIANVYSGDLSASGNSEYIDRSFMFVYDWQVVNFSLNVVTGNASSTFDVEVVGVG